MISGSFTTIVAVAFAAVGAAHAATLLVGAGKPYATPCAAFAAAHDGDTVLIDAGLYKGDVCPVQRSNLVIRGVNGMAHIDADGKNSGGKAIWVVQGMDTYVENIEFSGCHVPDLNGAGIRQEGRNLTIRHCSFHDNEDGILAGADSGSTIDIRNSWFANNGAGDGYSHNLYIGAVKQLTFMGNESRGAKAGHTLKSRAAVTAVQYNRIMDGDSGTTSYEIDAPNGGYVIVQGNVIEKGVNAQNSTLVTYGEEGFTKPLNGLYVVSNTMENRRSGGSPVFVRSANGTHEVRMYNNLLLGRGTMFAGTVGQFDSSANVAIASGYSTQVRDLGTYDYHLMQGATAIDAGNAQVTGSMWMLVPQWEYNDTLNVVARPVVSPLDIGAFEYVPPSAIHEPTASEPMANVALFPNPGTGVLRATNIPVGATVRIVSGTGAVVAQRPWWESREGVMTFEGLHLPTGTYTLVVTTPDGGVATRAFAVEK